MVTTTTTPVSPPEPLYIILNINTPFWLICFRRSVFMPCVCLLQIILNISTHTRTWWSIRQCYWGLLLSSGYGVSLQIFPMSTWVSFGFSSFLQICVWWSMMDWHPIQSVFMTYAQYCEEAHTDMGRTSTETPHRHLSSASNQGPESCEVATAPLCLPAKE